MRDKFVCAGKSFVEVAIRIDPPREGRRSRAFRWYPRTASPPNRPLTGPRGV